MKKHLDKTHKKWYSRSRILNYDAMKVFKLGAYYDRWVEGTNIIPPEGMIRNIADFLSAAKEAIDEKQFAQFAAEYKRDFEGFALFVFDHQGFYDRQRRYYNWQTLQPVAEAIFKEGVKLPHKSRLIELTGNHKLALYALDDDDVANFVLSHFKLYAELKDKIEDKHGRKQSILEAMFARLQRMKKGSDFEAGSPLWALEMLIKRFVYNL